jgi:hypothetical protein
MRDSNIYGADDNAMAESIASGALGTPDPNANSGNPIDQEARSKGNYQDSSTSLSAQGEGKAGKEVNNEVVKISNKSDSRASSKGN